MENNIDVSIIIVNYNTFKVTQDCIDSIFEHTLGINFEVILVDNASHDGSEVYLKNDKRITFIESNKNLGFGKANNLGFNYAKGKYIFLLNSDTILLNNAVKEFYDAMEEQPQSTACIGTLLKAADGITENNSYGKLPTISTTLSTLFNIYLRIRVDKQSKEHKVPPFFVEYIIGADIFIRRNVIEEMGLFDPDFFMYFEESEMQYRYKKNGYNSIIIDSPKIIHMEGVSSNSSGYKLTGKKALMYYSGMLIYMGKRYKGLKYIVFRILFLFFVPLMLYNKCSLKTLALPFKTNKRIINDNKI